MKKYQKILVTLCVLVVGAVTFGISNNADATGVTGITVSVGLGGTAANPQYRGQAGGSVVRSGAQLRAHITLHNHRLVSAVGYATANLGSRVSSNTPWQHGDTANRARASFTTR